MSGEAVLSDREREILQLVAEGLTNREIAQRLSISHNTVKVHLSNIFEKTGVASRTEATLYAIQHRIVDVPGGENEDMLNGEGRQSKKNSLDWLWAALIGIFLIALLIISLSTKSEEEIQSVASLSKSARWNQLAGIPEPLADFASVAYSGQIFIMGGNSEDGVSRGGYKYIPNTDEWVELQDKPTAVFDIDAAVVGNLIYVPGGTKEDGQISETMEIYDPNADLWIDEIPLPNPITNYALTEFEGNLFIIGGWNGQDNVTTVSIYNPQTEQWSQGKSMPENLVSPQCFIVGSEIFVYETESATSDPSSKPSWIFKYFPGDERETGGNWLDVSEFPNQGNVVGIVSIAQNVFIIAHETQNNQGYLTPIVRNLDNSNWIWLESVAVEDITDLDVTFLGNFIHLIGKTNMDGLVSSEHLSFQAIFSTLIPVLP